MKSIGVAVVLFSLLFGCTAAENYPTFEEGGPNTTIEVTAIVNEYRAFTCTVKNDSESELKELIPLPLPVPDKDNWEWIKEEYRAQLIIPKISNSNSDNVFSCEAIDTEGHKTTLTYHITAVYEGTTFEEGATNSTIHTGLTMGTKAEIRCTVDTSNPPITELTIEPRPPVGNLDYKVIGDGLKWIGIEFATINDLTPTGFTCTAKSNITEAKLTYSLKVYDGIGFHQGEVNCTISQTLITETTDMLICSVAYSDPPLQSLIFEPVPLPGNEDYKIEQVNDTFIEVKFLKINDKTPTEFTCTAKNNMTTATMGYNLLIKDPVAPVFTMGANETLWTEIATGANHTFECAVVKGTALPEITSISAEPPEESNWRIIHKDLFSLEIQITKADSSLNNKNFVCTATNGLRNTLLDYQNYVGGPPIAIEPTLDTVTSKNQMRFSLSVIDRNTAPAKFILVNHKGLMKNNVTLRVPIPNTFDDQIQYSFTDFMTHQLTDIAQDSEIEIFANNTLGEVFIKTITVPIPARKSSPNSGAIAAGILVPFFLILGGVIIGAVVFYFWKKNKTGKSISFSKISSADSQHIEDAKSTYGAL